MARAGVGKMEDAGRLRKRAMELRRRNPSAADALDRAAATLETRAVSAMIRASRPRRRPQKAI